MAKYLFAILFINILVVSVYAQSDNRISATWQVEKYDITVTLPANDTDRTMNVQAVLTLKNISSSAARTATLRISPSAEVLSGKVNGAAADISKGQEKIGTGTLQRIVFRLPSVAPGASATVEADYKLTVTDNSGLSAISSLTSQFLPLSFWYPTPNSWFFVRGADYAPMKIKVVDPAGRTTISAGTETAGAFEAKYHSQPFFITGNFERMDASGVSVYLLPGSDADAKKRAGELAAFANDARSHMTKYFGTAPDIPLRIVAARRGAGFSSCGTILVDDGVFRRAKLDSQAAMVIGEAVAKMWIGCKTAVTGDGYGTILEGLARYTATEFLESKYGKDVADAERVRQRTAYAAVALNDAPLTLISPLDGYYYTVASNKGSMVWRLIEIWLGREKFVQMLSESSADGILDLAEIRAAMPERKEMLTNLLDEVTDTNLMIGLPQTTGGETKVALRNTGKFDTAFDVSARLASGKEMTANVVLKPTSFGEVSFKTTEKIVRVEADPDKLYPQTNYSDDIAPKEFSESDPILAVKRPFDKQDFAGSEKIANAILVETPHFDDIRILLARALLAQNKTAEAERQFKAALDEPLPTARTIAWGNVGLAQIAAKAGRNDEARELAQKTILADAEFGASFAARAVRDKLPGTPAPSEEIKSFFTRFDAAARSNRKADLEALFMPGESVRFANGISGQTTEWSTTVVHTYLIDPVTMVAEVQLSIKLLNRNPETGPAVFRLTKSSSGWKMASVDSFEVR
jgi:hypothetical protein